MRNRSLFLALVLAILLVLVAVLQFRWVGQLTRFETERLEASLRRQSGLVGRQIERELTGLLVAFSAPTAQELQQRLGRWRNASDTERLLRDLYRFDLRTGQLHRIAESGSPAEQPVEWPSDLSELRPPLQRIAAALPNRDVDPRRLLARLGGPIRLDVPAIVRPLPNGAGATPRRRRALARVAGPSVVIVHLDPEELRQLIVHLVRTRFEEDLGLDVEVGVAHRNGGLLGTVRGGRWIDAAAAPESPGSPETSGPRVSRDALDRERRVADRRFEHSIRVPIGGLGERGTERSLNAPNERGARSRLATGGADWFLLVRFDPGEIRAPIARQRLGNLVLGGTVLALLAATSLLLYRNARRAEEFARRQTEFVASISHELHTPLTAISSAGANLADGVVREPEKVREYGRLLQREGTRLGRLVGQALALAGVQSGARRDEHEQGRIDSALERARDDVRLVAAAAGGEIVVDDPERMQSLPSVAVSEEDLRRAFDNLFENSFKYGARRVVLSVAPATSTDRRTVGSVVLCLDDDGPGIAVSDRRRIWEPFRRGSNVTEGPISGSGLGLHLVRTIVASAGGSIELDREPSPLGGARFVLRLPLAATDGSGAGSADDSPASAEDPGLGP